MKIIKGDDKDYMLKIHEDAYTWFSEVEFDMGGYSQVHLRENGQRVLTLTGRAAIEFCKLWRLL